MAPLTPQSATGHGITYQDPLMVSHAEVPTEMDGIAVDGRPADCVKLAIASLWEERFGRGSRPDLVISGMNAGANCGINVIYSGTVAAAIEAAFLGIGSIAVSLHLGRGKPRFDVAAWHARRTIERLLAGGSIGAHTCLNVNIPRCEEAEWVAPSPDTTFQSRTGQSVGTDLEESLEIEVCPMNTHGIIDRFERRESPAGQGVLLGGGGGLDFHATDEGTDVERMMARRITVTPLQFDLTDHMGLHLWRSRLGGG
ncbi:MAG: 5'/3'-nucleotidase SurE [Deltaproteobacteria bacterium]|nr:5'/3'-nucleotidase SurE [Deltaproteobacteria bacterium]